MSRASSPPPRRGADARDGARGALRRGLEAVASAAVRAWSRASRPRPRTLRVPGLCAGTTVAFDAHERDLFDQLITVKNVGPSTAIAILSGAGPRDIAALIAREDVAGLTKIKGIGKKTAEMLVVELREKCEMMVLSWNLGGTKPAASPAGIEAIT